MPLLGSWGGIGGQKDTKEGHTHNAYTHALGENDRSLGRSWGGFGACFAARDAPFLCLSPYAPYILIFSSQRRSPTSAIIIIVTITCIVIPSQARCSAPTYSSIIEYFFSWGFLGGEFFKRERPRCACVHQGVKTPYGAHIQKFCSCLYVIGC